MPTPAPLARQPLRLAMWSGPRNLSTALMRSFGARQDTVVVDEPLYAHYLRVTGLDHPGREEILAHHETDWRKVVRQLTEEPLPPGKRLCFQKHMAHHLLDGLRGPWLDKLSHAFLIREPAGMLASLLKVWPKAGLADTGLPQQWGLFETLTHRLGHTPPVLDAADLARDPRGQLSALCERLEIEFDPAMLSWAKGPRDTDGVWGPHWYGRVYETTGFEPFEPGSGEVAPRHAGLLEDCRILYGRLHAHRLRG
jgi:hypothetical protein